MLVSIPKNSSFGSNGQFRVSEMVLRGRGISPIGAMANFAAGTFLLGGGNLTRNVSDNWNLFQSEKQHSVHSGDIEHFSCWGGELANFWLVGGGPLSSC